MNLHSMVRAGARVFISVVAVSLAACSGNWNDPYPAADHNKKIVYEEFNSRPKHLDPVQSYVEDEAWFLYSIYEPLLDYHYLKRPYTLIPSTVQALPALSYLDAQGKKLPDDADAERIAYSVYEFHLKPGIRYQPHPAFAQDSQGKPVYFDLDDAKLGNRRQIADFEHTGSRELVAADYAYQLKRIALPGIHSPGFETFKVIDGMEPLAQHLREDVKSGKIAPNSWVDLRNYALTGVETPDAHTLRIKIHGKYPQFMYWMAMTFVVPVPWEADRFYAQPGMAKRDLTLDMWPVGTGPFMLTRNEPLRVLQLDRNPNYHEVLYPCEGEASDRANGMLDDCGKRLPLLDTVRFNYEKEAIPFWNKFLQGYYDQYASKRFAGMASFDSALQLQGGSLSLTDQMRAQGITLKTEVEPALEYFFFNMLDPLWGNGGKTPEERERARKLRQAVGIALDTDEYLALIKNGLGVASQGPVPPGIPGFREGAQGLNPNQYTWVNGHPSRKSIDEAKRLLAEAGYPDGRDAKTGEPLILYFDGYDTFKRERLELITKQMSRINIQLVPRLTEWNRFQDKVFKGTQQFTFWGWNADYPDPENFLFLFHSKQGRVKYQGENNTNYNDPEYDKLFERFRSMDVTSPDRQALVDKMVDLTRRDLPVPSGWHNEQFTLTHAWLGNTKPGKIIHSYYKYWKVDPVLREKSRAAWNQPTLWPLLALLGLIVAVLALAVRRYRRNETTTARETEAQP